MYTFTKEELYKEYIEKQQSTHKIAKIYGCSQPTVRRTLIKFGIELRKPNDEVRARSIKLARGTGYEGIIGYYWCGIKHSAKVRNISFDITIAEAWELFVKQDGVCALSGIPIYLPKNCKEHESGVGTASLDRIDSSKGYNINNVQWVHKKLNMMKREMSNSDFIIWCKLVTIYQNREVSN
jgi:hypothetical protein